MGDFYPCGHFSNYEWAMLGSISWVYIIVYEGYVFLQKSSEEYANKPRSECIYESCFPLWNRGQKRNTSAITCTQTATDPEMLSSNFMWEHASRRFGQKHKVTLPEELQDGKILVDATTYRPARGCKHTPSLDLCCATPGICVIHTARLTMDRCGGSGTGKETPGRWKAQDSPIWHWVQTSSPGYIVGKAKFWNSDG